MLKYVLAGVVALGIGGSTLVYAQQRGDGPRIASSSATSVPRRDECAGPRGVSRCPHRGRARRASADARSGQELAGGRDRGARSRRSCAPTSARRTARSAAIATSASIRSSACNHRADEMAALAAGMKQVAEAADPLYKSLDDGQKRRLAMLTRLGMRDRFMQPHGRRDRGRDGHRWHERRQERQDRRDRRNAGPRRRPDHGSKDGSCPGPETGKAAGKPAAFSLGIRGLNEAGEADLFALQAPSRFATAPRLHGPFPDGRSGA